MIAVLCGGVGGARMLRAISGRLPAGEITAIVNTADDIEVWGLYVAPDLDTVVYTLAGTVDDTRGWGVRDDTHACLQAMDRLGEPTWFRLGDADVATHILRTRELRQGRSLTEVTRELCSRLGVGVTVLPMSDERVSTGIRTRERGMIGFQDYFVRYRAALTVEELIFEGIDDARPAPGVLQAIEEADAVVVAPSNPLVSIGPILAVKGLRAALARTPAPVVGVSPLIGGRAVKGPADRMLVQLGHEATARGIAALYDDFLDGMVLDRADAGLAASIAAMGVRVAVCRTLMALPGAADELAATVLELAAKCNG